MSRNTNSSIGCRGYETIVRTDGQRRQSRSLAEGSLFMEFVELKRALERETTFPALELVLLRPGTNMECLAGRLGRRSSPKLDMRACRLMIMVAKRLGRDLRGQGRRA